MLILLLLIADSPQSEPLRVKRPIVHNTFMVAVEPNQIITVDSFPTPGINRPAVILIPAEGEQQSDWVELAKLFQSYGLTAILCRTYERSFSSSDLQPLLLEIRHRLPLEAQVSPYRIAYLGSQESFSSAIMAGRGPVGNVRAMVGLSPLATIDGQPLLKPLSNLTATDLLLVTSSQDQPGLRTVATLEATCHHCATRSVDAIGRGVQLTHRDPSTALEIVSWLKALL